MRLAAEEWAPIGPEGGPAAPIAADPQHPGHILIFDSSVRESYDGGLTWRSEPAVAVEPLVITFAPSDSKIVYLGGDGGVLRSADGGATWRPTEGLPANIRVNGIAISPASPDIVYIAAGTGLFVSRSGGASWQQLSVDAEPYPFACVAVDPHDPSLIVTGTFSGNAKSKGGTFRSSDGGASWHRVGTDTGQFLEALVFDPSVSGTAYLISERGLLKSVDRGSTWSVASNGLSAGGSDPFDALISARPTLAIDASGANVLYATGVQGVYVSRDSAASWQLELGGYAFGVSVDVAGTVFASTAAFGITRSDNHGDSWSDVNSNRRMLTITSIVPDPLRSALYVTTGLCAGAFRLRGGEWTRLPLRDLSIVGQILVDGTGGLYVTTPSRIDHSTDEGMTWTDTAIAASGIGELARDPRSSIVYAATSNGVFQNTDGVHWELLRGSPANLSKMAVGSDGVLYTGTYADGVFRSTNGGITWTRCSGVKQGLPIRGIVVHPALSGNVVVITQSDSESSGIFFSNDSGKSWRKITITPEPTAEPITAAADATGHWFIATSAGVFESDASFNGWIRLGGPLATVLAADRDVLYLGTFGESVFALTLTPSARRRVVRSSIH